MSRFTEDEKAESERLLKNMFSGNTERNTKSSGKMFISYLENKKMKLDYDLVNDTTKFDEMVSCFLCSVHKSDGNDFKKNSYMSLKMD